MPAEPAAYARLIKLREYVSDPIIYEFLYDIFAQETENPADARWQSKYERKIEEAATKWRPRFDENRKDRP
jgi:hypothetical protein